MSPPGKRTGLGRPAEPRNTSSPATAKQRKLTPEPTVPSLTRRRLRVAFAVWCPPAGRRRLGMLFVRRCPRCLHAHTHRATSAVAAAGAIRAGSCGAVYKIKLRPSTDTEGQTS